MEVVSQFTPQESNVFDLLQRLQRRQQLKVESANLIRAWWKLKQEGINASSPKNKNKRELISMEESMSSV
jgi:hypothetical protein